LNVALVELPDLRALPPTEIALPKPKPGAWPILTYDGKWQPGSPMYEALSPHYPADLSAARTRKLQDLAKRAFRLVGCRDYARVDFRVNEKGQPFILEVNPNPEIRESAGFACGLGSAELAHEQFVIDLVRHAMQRKSRSEPEA
jgi:D-alanine-D-alanine ligase